MNQIMIMRQTKFLDRHLIYSFIIKFLLLMNLSFVISNIRLEYWEKYIIASTFKLDIISAS